MRLHGEGGEAGAFKATPPDGAHLWPSWTSPVPSQPRTHPPLPVTGPHIKLTQRIRAWIRLLAVVFTLHLQEKKFKKWNKSSKAHVLLVVSISWLPTLRV